MRLTYAGFVKGGRFLRKSSRSMRRNCRRHLPQNISMGFKSGDRAGTSQVSMFLAAYAFIALGWRRKGSLSHSTVHGVATFVRVTTHQRTCLHMPVTKISCQTYHGLENEKLNGCCYVCTCQNTPKDMFTHACDQSFLSNLPWL